jgi:hypothetical protein
VDKGSKDVREKSFDPAGKMRGRKLKTGADRKQQQKI